MLDHRNPLNQNLWLSIVLYSWCFSVYFQLPYKSCDLVPKKFEKKLSIFCDFFRFKVPAARPGFRFSNCLSAIWSYTLLYAPSFCLYKQNEAFGEFEPSSGLAAKWSNEFKRTGYQDDHHGKGRSPVAGKHVCSARSLSSSSRLWARQTFEFSDRNLEFENQILQLSCKFTISSLYSPPPATGVPMAAPRGGERDLRSATEHAARV